ncbi:hypothetical protein [Methylocucumis oryzae]|uniref:hypothetical protein n=1 Tax=Methylocucumis oryzae TaxID=1632867 RepID=UPI0012FF466D|nr:hypothetical protein [Methylocucumis oryzae]
MTKDFFEFKLKEELYPIKTDLAGIKSDMTFVKWAMGVVVVSILLLVKAVF